jgi:hypothetical protein
MTYARTISLVFLTGLGALAFATPGDGRMVITFDKIETGKPM